MAGADALQIAVRTGAAEPPGMALSPGQPVGPLSIGRMGTWRIVAPGVLEEHGFLYFNGTELFLQSTHPHSPLLANGAPIPGDWTAIYAPCEITVGGASLWFGAPQAAPSSMRPGPPPGPPPQQYVESPSAAGRQPFSPRVQGNDNEDPTRVQPIEQAIVALRAVKGPGAPPPVGPPVFGAPAALGGYTAPPAPPGTPSFGPTPFVAGPTPAPMTASVPGAGAPPAQQSWLAARWREASGPKKALVFLMAPLVWAVWVIFTDKVPPPPPRPATSASVQPSAKASAGAASAGPQAAAPPATEAPDAPALPAGSPSARAAAGAAPSSSPATSGAKTPQRDAADAVAAGAFDRAARLYDELAKAHPDVPAYAEAARIMKAKAGKP